MKSLQLRTGIALAVFLAAAGYFLWQERSAHVALAITHLPYLLILLCPLMHVFMHHGHGHQRLPSPDRHGENDLSGMVRQTRFQRLSVNSAKRF